MATLREYFDSDFGHNFRFHITLPLRDGPVEGVIVYDFAGLSAFLAVYIPGVDKNLEFFVDLISQIEYGKTQFSLAGQVSLPQARDFPGQLHVENKPDFVFLAQYYGDTEWMNIRDIPASKRVFVYAEADLATDEIDLLKARAKGLGLEAQVRTQRFARERNNYEPPLAFVSHDSRDKDIARQIAVTLQEMHCTVWYDEFSLRVGDNLRESIEKGLKECRKCILVLSPNFISNKGWTKMEFDSIFTREILEEEKLVLPVWYQVSKKDVYDYSPKLSIVYGLNWEQLGKEKVCRQLHRVIINA